MAEQKFNTPSEALNVSPTEHTSSNIAKCNTISSSCDSRINYEKGYRKEENLSCMNQSTESNVNVCKDASLKSPTESRNGVSDGCANKINSFLRPSTLVGDFSVVFGGKNSGSPAESTFATKCPLKSPKLNLTPSKLRNFEESLSSSSSSSFSQSSSVSKLPFQQSKNPFSNAICFDNEKNELSTPKLNVLQTDNISGSPITERSQPSFANFSNIKPIGCSNNINSSILVPNFVFGQNLHERVADGIATSVNTDRSNSEASNGDSASDMLFTSVLTSKEITKENLNRNTQGCTKEPFSLIEDAARCQEARANKRKYEEVLVTTGEEDEENILQVSVKLFAFDSGTWVERGRGILRLNDKNCDGTVVSRIVIRTIGSLRVVLNTKIWSGMSLNRASERSIRLTAMDPKGQLKIFLIQASPKDMGTLFRFLDARLKRCQDSPGDPEKKKMEKVAGDDEGGEKSKT